METSFSALIKIIFESFFNKNSAKTLQVKNGGEINKKNNLVKSKNVFCQEPATDVFLQ